jgi:hypothetical protein
MSLETQRGSSETKRDLGRAVKKPTITTFGERPRGSLRPRRWPAPVAAACHEAFGSISTEEGKLRLAKAWKAEDLVKG